MTRSLDTDLNKQTWLSNPSVSAEFIKLSENRTNLTFFRITLLEKPNPMLKVPLRSVFYSNTLLHPSFFGKCIRIQVSSQRNFQDGGDLVLLNEPNVFQTSGKKKTWEETTLWSQTRVSRQKVGKIRRVREKTSAHNILTTSIHTIVCMHIWPPVFFIISSLSLRGNTHSLRFVKYKVRKDWGRFSFKPGPHRLLFKLIEYLVLKTTCPFAVRYFKLIKA